MTIIAIFLGIIGLVVCLIDWRKGLFVCIAVGFLQDPIRKMIPGEPVFITMMVGLFVAITILSALLEGETLSFEPILAWYDVIRAPLILFVILVLIQSGLTAMRFGNTALAVIGTVSYLAPLPALLLTYYYAENIEAIKKLMAFYVAMAVAAALGVYLAFFDVDLPGLRQIGTGLVIYDMGMVLEAYPGFMRSPEIMAWHISAAVCLLTILFAVTPKPGARMICVTLMVLLTIAGFLTGRRKMVIELVLFLAFFGSLLLYFRIANRKPFAIGLLGGGACIAVAFKMLLPSEAVWQFNPYMQRSITAFADAPERFTNLGLGSIEWAFNRSGMLGKGAGTGSQGAQHFGGGTVLVGGAGEGGLGKIMVELGIPGLLLTAWLGIALALYSWQILKLTREQDAETATLAYGLIAFVAANIPVFISASQVYGDPFVLLMLGWLFGLFLSMPRLMAPIEIVD
jgi:hypothetical protein